MEQDPKSGERSIMRELVPDWRPTRRQLLWTIRIVLVLVVLLSILTLVGWPFDVTLWDWLDLLIIPVVLAIGGFLFTRSENRATQAAAERRALDDTLQAYLDGMAQLVTDKDEPLHEAQAGDSLSTVARARTLTVLSRLDHTRKRSVLEFLYESRLIDKEQTLLDDSNLIERRHNIVSLQQADLHGTDLVGINLIGVCLEGADLRGAYLIGADLQGANLERARLRGAYLGADLRGAILRSADLTGAYVGAAKLRQADLRRAFLTGADLQVADLGWADMRRTKLLRADLRRAILTGADLRGALLEGANLEGARLGVANLQGAMLRGANLIGADLQMADLRGAKGVTNEQLSAADYLIGATMPDGQSLESVRNPNGPTFEEWLKDKNAQGKDEKN